jgi:hypothetical protein
MGVFLTTASSAVTSSSLIVSRSRLAMCHLPVRLAYRPATVATPMPSRAAIMISSWWLRAWAIWWLLSAGNSVSVAKAFASSSAGSVESRTLSRLRKLARRNHRLRRDWPGCRGTPWRRRPRRHQPAPGISRPLHGTSDPSRRRHRRSAGYRQLTPHDRTYLDQAWPGCGRSTSQQVSREARGLRLLRSSSDFAELRTFGGVPVSRMDWRG